MRMVFNPIYVYPDGHGINRHDEASALLCLDPDKLTLQGLQEGLEHWNSEGTVERLSRFDPQDAPGIVEDHFINNFIGPDFRSEYIAKVLTGATEENLESRVRQYVADKIEAIRSDPEKFLEHVHSSLEMGADQNDFHRVWHPLANPDEKARRKRKIEQAIDKQPDYLKALIKNENMSIVCAQLGGHLMTIMSGAVSAYGSRAIFLPIRTVDAFSIDDLTLALKEELLHYYDHKMNVTKNCQQFCAALWEDEEKVGAIEELGRAMHPIHKTPISGYPDNRDSELLVEYFLIRDHLQGKQQNGDCLFTGLIKPKQNHDAIDQQMSQLFGEDLHRAYRAFEQELIAEAATLQTDSPAKY